MRLYFIKWEILNIFKFKFIGIIEVKYLASLLTSHEIKIVQTIDNAIISHDYYDYYDYYIDNYHSIAIVNIRAILRGNCRLIVDDASRIPRSLWCVCILTKYSHKLGLHRCWSKRCPPRANIKKLWNILLKSQINRKN